jgi:hypothetical protein
MAFSTIVEVLFGIYKDGNQLIEYRITPIPLDIFQKNYRNPVVIHLDSSTYMIPLQYKYESDYMCEWDLSTLNKYIAMQNPHIKRQVERIKAIQIDSKPKSKWNFKGDVFWYELGCKRRSLFEDNLIHDFRLVGKRYLDSRMLINYKKEFYEFISKLDISLSVNEIKDIVQKWIEDKYTFLTQYIGRLDVYIGVDGEFYREEETKIEYKRRDYRE